MSDDFPWGGLCPGIETILDEPPFAKQARWQSQLGPYWGHPIWQDAVSYPGHIAEQLRLRASLQAMGVKLPKLDGYTKTWTGVWIPG